MAEEAKRYYFDCNALWKFYEGKQEKGISNTQLLVENRTQPIFVSSLTLLEFFSVLMKKFRQGYLKRKGVRQVTERLRRDIGISTQVRPFELVPLPEGSFRSAEKFLLQYADTFNISSNDSLHLAIVENIQSTLPSIVIVTSDHPLQKVCEQAKLAYYDPEID